MFWTARTVKTLCGIFPLCPPQIIALVMVSIGVYARMMKHAGEWSFTDRAARLSSCSVWHRGSIECQDSDAAFLVGVGGASTVWSHRSAIKNICKRLYLHFFNFTLHFLVICLFIILFIILFIVLFISTFIFLLLLVSRFMFYGTPVTAVGKTLIPASENTPPWCFLFLLARNNSVRWSGSSAHISLWLPLSFPPVRDSSGMSVRGPCCNADGRGDPHVLHHLLWLRGLPEGKHLPSADSKSGVFSTSFNVFRFLSHHELPIILIAFYITNNKISLNACRGRIVSSLMKTRNSVFSWRDFYSVFLLLLALLYVSAYFL